ncbi:MAG: response regulator transcription factor [Actinobacteria bacterium]|nr:response regulator transcription factor [Actinomycetota bacterium]
MSEEAASLERILIVENSFRVGIALLIARIFRNEDFPNLITLVIDSDEVATALESFQPDVVVLDVDSLRHLDALNVAVEIRAIRPGQVIIFGSDHPNPVLVKEGMIAAVWSRAYWLNEPSKNPGVVLQEIRRAFKGGKSLNPLVLETAFTQSRHVGRLTPQQHRVMRLMSNGGSNSAIAKECGITVKAVERTISTASRLLDVTPSTKETNHRVNAAMRYRQSMLFADPTDTW